MDVRCRLLGHRRSREWATFNHVEHQWHSICLRCHERLIREQEGQWVSEKHHEKEAA